MHEILRQHVTLSE